MSVEIRQLHKQPVTLFDITQPWSPDAISLFLQKVDERSFNEQANWEGILQALASSPRYCAAVPRLRNEEPCTIAIDEGIVVLTRVIPPTNIRYPTGHFQSLVQILPRVQLVARTWDTVSDIVLEAVQSVIPAGTHYILQERQWLQPSQAIFGKLVIPGNFEC